MPGLMTHRRNDMETKKLHRFENPVRVLGQLLNGKSITRSLFNLAIERYEMMGKVLDLGSKNGTSSYYQHIKQSDDCQITFTDLVPAPGVVQVDVEKVFPFPDCTFDTVISFHLMEHVYDFWKMPSEIHRVLKPGGRVIVSVPFIHEYHADPTDYWRMSSDAVVKLFQSAGLKVLNEQLVGEGITTYAATKVMGMILPKSLKPFGLSLAYLIFTGIDRLLHQVWKHRKTKGPAELFALDVVCEFTK